MDYTFWTLIAVLVVSGLIKAYFLIAYFAKIIKYKDTKNDKSPGLSVIICARNEAEALSENLPQILNQNHPDFEVIVVNDRSLDNTEGVLEAFEKQYPQLKIMTLDEKIKGYDGKKLGMTLAIKKAKNDYLVFTDADCKPETEGWLLNMANAFSDEKEILIAYSPFRKKKGLLNLLCRIENAYTAIHYLSFAIAGKPYMATGRNMAYTKPLFYKHKGFSGHWHIPFGDDDLFIQKAASSNNSIVVLDHDNRVITESPDTFSAWFKQKRRHLAAGRYYLRPVKNLLGLSWFSGFLFYVALILLATQAVYQETLQLELLVALIFSLAILILHSILFILIRSKLGVKDNWFWISIPVDIYYHCVYYPLMGLYTFFNRKKITWK